MKVSLVESPEHAAQTARKHKRAWKLRIEYWQSVSKQWYFHIKGRNGEIVVSSEGYKRLRSCETSMDLFPSAIERRFIPKETALNPEGVYFRT